LANPLNDDYIFFPDSELNSIRIRGAREHNLKNISVEIPRDKIVVITGLSGSGKSSLAFDTIYAEGQRRYVECMSAYARQFLGIMKKPDVDSIDGLSPAISIEQKSIGHNPRSTVGTVTEIYDYLRLLYAKAGIQYCVNCNIEVKQQTLDQIVDALLKHPVDTKVQVLSPVVKGRKGHYRELFEQLRKQGFTRVRIDGEMQEITESLQLPRYKVHNIELLVDRIVIDEGIRTRLTESVDTALHLGDDGVSALIETSENVWTEVYFSTTYSCPSCGTSYATPAPNMFSFNSPFGSCSECEGLGEKTDFDMELVMPDLSVSIDSGGIGPLGKARDTWLWKQVTSYCKDVGIDRTKPISEIADHSLQALLYGTDGARVTVEYKNTEVRHQFIGVLPTLKHQLEQTASATIRKGIEQYFAAMPCPSCNGARLKEAHLFIRVNDMNIHDVSIMSIVDCLQWFSTVMENLSDRQQIIADLIVREISKRLSFLVDVGLTYLTLHRSARSLSGGESQRIRLASQIGSQLVGVTYVLDEPSIGLHQHDNQKLIKSLKNLRDIGNTVVVVEHDKDMILQADYVIDIGPGAGVHGGKIIAQFDPSSTELASIPSTDSLTLQYLRGEIVVEAPLERRVGNGNSIVLKGAKGNNLLDVTLTLPLGQFVCVTGMSGSGKSTLINDTLYPIIAQQFYRAETKPLAYEAIEGLENIDKVIEIDQSPIGRTPRSNPATYTGLFTQIRDFFTLLPESKIRGYKSGRFSFNVVGGRCEECEGAGIRKIEMSFLPDVFVSCDNCNGARYNSETLAVKFKGKSIANVLDMTVEEACEFFVDIPKIYKKLKTLSEVGLGYISLGQQAPTLSGGEAQRVKLATELSKQNTGKTLYVLDEPTTGLHFEDINILLRLLDKLVDKGNSVVVIEHNLDVICHADHVIDLGPGGGIEGGKIVACGTPEQVAASELSITGKYIKNELLGRIVN